MAHVKLRKRDDLPISFKSTEEDNIAKFENAKYGVTARMFRVVYFQVKLNFPLMHHNEFVKLFKLNNVAMGTRHYERTKATDMADFISKSMNKELLQAIKNSDTPVSIITDAATDKSQNHYLVVLLQIIENNAPKVVFWRLLDVGSDESAEGLLIILIKAFEEDKLQHFIKKRLTGFGADGVGTMMGKHGGLGKKLGTYVDRTLVSVHCMAHRLNLVIRRAFTKDNALKFMFNLESLVKEIYGFYYVGGHKRKSHMAGFFDGVQVSLSSIFEVRWVASEKRAIVKLIRYYPYILMHLKEVTTNRAVFNEKTRALATGILKHMLDKNFYMILHFLCDILDVLEETSLLFQRRYGLLIEQSENVLMLISKLERLAASNGQFVQAALQGTKCADHACLSVADYESHSEVPFMKMPVGENNDPNDFILKASHNSQYPKLQTMRFKMVQSLIDQMYNYFPDKNFDPDKNLDKYSALDPRKWPSDLSDIDQFWLDDIKALHEMIGPEEVDEQNIVASWRKMLFNILEDKNYCKYKQDIIQFWQHYLKTSLVPNSMHFIVIRILAIPVGSADAERAFSYYFHIRSKRRERLTREHIESFMRIRINGPKDISSFSALKYAKAWAAKGNYLTDSPLPLQATIAQPTVTRPTNEDGMVLAEEENKYMDGTNYV